MSAPADEAADSGALDAARRAQEAVPALDGLDHVRPLAVLLADLGTGSSKIKNRKISIAAATGLLSEL